MLLAPPGLKRIEEQEAKGYLFPRLVDVAPANAAKRARKNADVHGHKASKRFRQANRAAFVR